MTRVARLNAVNGDAKKKSRSKTTSVRRAAARVRPHAFSSFTRPFFFAHLCEDRSPLDHIAKWRCLVFLCQGAHSAEEIVLRACQQPARAAQSGAASKSCARPAPDTVFDRYYLKAEPMPP